MKRVLTANLLPGMTLAENVYTYNNEQLILTEGTTLTDQSITKLEFYGIINVMVEDSITPIKDNVSYSDNSTLSYAQRLQQTNEFKQFKADFENASSSFENCINKIINGECDFNLIDFTDPIYNLLQQTCSPSNVFDMLHSLRQYDDATYIHCVNVSLISNVLGQWLKFSDEDLKLLTVAGLLHDVGKIMIPDQIITKPSKLTDYEYTIVQTHPMEGFKLLKNLNLDIHIKNAVLMHHERCDGSGYPLHLSADQIDPFAKIVAIADVYDAMTSARVYRGPLCPFVAISLFESEGLQKYDTKAIITFLTNIVNTYLLNRVRLNNGLEGDIVYINRDHLAKPTIRVGSKYIDLSQNPDLYIEAII
ncbi:HD-GYP domain-containing protein [Butyrivibrio sp. NC3005]|uniref:HD-GYP domain-containing protein n=1 Tax=Butyrivibrio sp. NC3005 TaxID=1280685 RepID=UPI00040533ED|nr:HD-GYP domain-containing protein [Butyrivibrio sp. NC3005]